MEPRCTKTYFVAGGRVERTCGELAEFFCAECGKARCTEHGDETFEKVNGRVLCEDCGPDAKVELARKAIADGKTMGQFLRELPDSEKLTPAELREYGRAYASARVRVFEEKGGSPDARQRRHQPPSDHSPVPSEPHWCNGGPCERSA